MYLYHFVPEEMEGAVLYPLNTLKRTLPTVFEKEKSKYEGREEVQETAIPGLGKWNDVIHLTPVDPVETRQALREAGSLMEYSWKVFCIDTSTLETSKLLIYLGVDAFGNKERVFLPFTQENYAKYSHIPDKTKSYYRECVQEGRRILIYGYVPHVLYGGSIDVSGVEIREYTN